MYRKSQNGSSCVGALPSMTAAIKAQRFLLLQGISCEVVSLSGKETKRGCAFGVEFDCEQESAARAALRAARVPVSQYFKKEETGTHDLS